MIKQELEDAEEAKLKGGAGRLFPEAQLVMGLGYLQQILIKVPLHPRGEGTEQSTVTRIKANNGVP